MIGGRPSDAADLFSGRFRGVKVLSDDWYSTHLKAVKVGGATFHIRERGRNGHASNSIVDSGTNAICLPKSLLGAMFEEFTNKQQELLHAAVFKEDYVPVASVKGQAWPDLTFILQGEDDDVALRVPPRDYWQLDADRAGQATSGLSVSGDNSSILGLPLMNGYFTVFDGEADRGRGVVRFAARTGPQ